jgi:hypothetical protein
MACQSWGILAPEPHVQDVHVTNPATVVRSDKMHRALDNSHSFIGRVLAVTAKLYASQRSVRRPDQPIQSPASRSRSRAVPPRDRQGQLVTMVRHCHERASSGVARSMMQPKLSAARHWPSSSPER